jgi:phosphatidate cytidylyltransferase
LGGLAAAIAVGLAAATVLADAGSGWRIAAVSAALGIVAQAGDLLESFVKRRLEVKDSGHLIPGHGGLFDRLDAILSSALAGAVLALALGRGVVLWQ